VQSVFCSVTAAHQTCGLVRLISKPPSAVFLCHAALPVIQPWLRPRLNLTCHGSCAGDELDSRAPSGTGYNFDGVLHGLSEDDMDIMRLREENEVLMNTLVRSKLEMAETQSEYPGHPP